MERQPPSPENLGALSRNRYSVIASRSETLQLVMVRGRYLVYQPDKHNQQQDGPLATLLQVAENPLPPNQNQSLGSKQIQKRSASGRCRRFGFCAIPAAGGSPCRTWPSARRRCQAARPASPPGHEPTARSRASPGGRREGIRMDSQTHIPLVPEFGPKQTTSICVASCSYVPWSKLHVRVVVCGRLWCVRVGTLAHAETRSKGRKDPSTGTFTWVV